MTQRALHKEGPFVWYQKVREKYRSDTPKRTFSILFHDVRLDIEEQNKKSEPFLFW